MPVAAPRTVVAGLVAVLVALAFATPASAATLTVTQTTDTSGGTCLPTACSLRQAIAAVNNGDMIVLPAGATPYTLTQGQLFLSKGITIEGTGGSASVIKAQDSDRVMLIAGNSSPVRLFNLVITGGATNKAGGGGLASAGPGQLVLDHVAVINNSVNRTVSGFNQGGGGVFSSGPLVLEHSVVSNNSATMTSSDGDNGGGGILSTHGDVTISDSTISNNTATVTPHNTTSVDNNGGGGVYQDGADLTIKRSLIQHNTATITGNVVSTPADGGGGIYQFGTNLLITDSTIASNTAHGPGVDKGGGGGVFDDGDTSRYIDSTIVNNSTDEPAATGPDANSDGGGGILFDTVMGGVVMANMTIAGNSAAHAPGGGINTFLTTPVEITNSILAGNTAGSGGGNCAGPVHSSGYNLADDKTADSCSFTATGDVLANSAGLGTLASNGGPTPTEPLLPGSPAINAGDPAGCTDLFGNSLPTDQRGVVRPQPAAGRCDIGAYESAPPQVQSSAATVAGQNVTLFAAVANPDALGGSVKFQYGSTPAYGRSTATQAIPALSSGSSFAAFVKSLLPGKYHFRAVVTNAAGRVNGPDRTFRIAPLKPRGFTATVEPEADLHPTAHFVISGRLKPPTAISPSIACRGKVSVRATLLVHAIATAHTTIGSNCRYQVKLTLGHKGLHGRFSAHILVTFGGNAVLAPASAKPVTVTFG